MDIKKIDTQPYVNIGTKPPVKKPDSIPHDDVVAEPVFSKAATMLHQLDKLAGQPSVINESKVAAIKEAIKNGTFVISPEKIADKMIASTIEMVQKRK